MNAPFNVLDVINRHPKAGGCDEFTAILSLLDSQETFQDPEFSLAVLEELKRISQGCIDLIEAAMLEQF